jgi:hypothetical protein
MGTQKNTGFTVIETMLFLGVAGALTVGVLVGSGLAINQQRYRDSVNSVKSFIQQQYSEVTNVVNGRNGSEACSNAVVIQPPAIVTPESRGTSECIMLGRYITIDESGKKMTASNVVGYRTPNVPEKASDIEEIQQNYRLGTSTIGQDIIDVPWGATIVKEKTTQPLKVSMLILRSPLSGSIMTYTHESINANLTAMVAVANSNTARNLCVDMSSGVVGGNRMSVQISPYATNQGSIQIPPESTSVCD